MEREECDKRNRVTGANRGNKVWVAPMEGRLKCNVGISWAKDKNLVGVGWIVRNGDEETMLHSRCAFNGVESLVEARRLGMIWAIESMTHHRLQNVTFEVEACELVGVVNRPKAWPAF